MMIIELIAEMESGELKISIIEDDDGERFSFIRGFSRWRKS